MQKVHASVVLFHDVHALLSEGSMFYSDLLQRLAQLNQTCEDLVSVASLLLLLWLVCFVLAVVVMVVVVGGVVSCWFWLCCWCC